MFIPQLAHLEQVHREVVIMVDQKWIDKYPTLYGPGAHDPDGGKGDVELDDYLARVMNKYTGAGGTFSTWKERHAFIQGVAIGHLYVESSADVPPVPDFWAGEQHYWLTGLMMGRAAKKIELAAPSVKSYILTFVAGAGISGVSVAKFFGLA